ncbi:MAG: hypothetical protein O7C65_00940, partial [Planctomycetota bacterium]|nr:hypothetical protein [Planctomycetota bacterium]
FPQCLVPACDEDLLPGDPNIDPPNPCVGDLDPDGDPNVIGPFPRAVGCGLSVITSNWFDSAPLIDDVMILRGNLVYGNVFSIKASDNNYLVIESEYTTPSHSGGGPENPQYVGFGEVTDVLVTAHGDLPGASALQVEVETHTSSGTSFMFVELWDWNWNRYTVVGFALLTGLVEGLDTLYPFPVGGAARYINQLDQRVLIRVWTLSVGGDSPPGFGLPPNSYRVHHDLINLGVFEDFGDIFEPNP